MRTIRNRLGDIVTESKLRAKIAYCETLRGKHLRLACFFRTKLAEYQEDLDRMAINNPTSVWHEDVRLWVSPEN